MSLTIVMFNSCDNDKPKQPTDIAVTSINLNKSTLLLAVGEEQTLTATVLPTYATEKTVTWSSNRTNIATVDTNGKVTAVAEGTATITARAGTHTITCEITIEGVRINGVIWATRNVAMPNTFAISPENAGRFYQWNRDTPWSTTGSITGWPSGNPSGTSWVRANDPCPAGWRVPTQSELQSLLNSGSSWTTVNGVNGRRFGSGNNTIFLPAAGWRSYGSGTLSRSGANGYYWSSTPQSDSSNAHHLTFDSSNANMGSWIRASGYNVRCVKE